MDLDRYAMLLERIVPGTQLRDANLSDDEVTPFGGKGDCRILARRPEYSTSATCAEVDESTV